MKRLEGLDSFKAIACLMVIIIHVTATPVTVLKAGTGAGVFADVVVGVLTVLNRFAKPSVPMFIFASGLALQYRYGAVYEDSGAPGLSADVNTAGRTSDAVSCGIYGSAEEINGGRGKFRYAEFLRRRAVKILVPYVIWCAVYYAWFIYFGIYEFDILFFAENLISGKMMYHLYFVIAIVQYYLLFGVLRSLTERCPAQFVLPAALAVNLAEVCLIPDLYYGRCFVTYITVFLLGTYTGKHIDTVNRVIVSGRSLAVLGVLSLVMGTVYTLQFTRSMAWERGIFDDDKIVFTVFSIAAALFIYGLCVLLAGKANNADASKTGNADGRIASSVNDRIVKSVNDGTVSNTGKGKYRKLLKKVELALGQIGKGSFYIFLAHPLFMLIAGEICRQAGITGVLKETALSLLLIFVLCIPLSIAYANLKGGRHRNRV